MAVGKSTVAAVVPPPTGARPNVIRAQVDTAPQRPVKQSKLELRNRTCIRQRAWLFRRALS